MVYVYDGSFEGLLTAIYQAYYSRKFPDRIICNKNFQQNFLDEYVHIATDEEKSQKVYVSIKTRISSEALRTAYYTYLSESDDMGTWIYEYLRLGWKVGSKLDNYLADDRVLRIHKLRQKVSFEANRMLGLLRFKQVSENTYYGPIEPDYNIITLLAPHFVQRLSDQNWIIHDIKRSLAAVYDQSDWYLTTMSLNQYNVIFAQKDSFEELWKQYFDSIAIKSRINPKLQRQHMPARYWRYLTEKV